jgi:PAS domain-containing protein
MGTGINRPPDVDLITRPDRNDPFAADWKILLQQFAAARTSTEDLKVLHLALNRLSTAALAADQDGRYVAVNNLAAELLGHNVQELERLHVWDVLPFESAAAGRKLWTTFTDAGEQRGSMTLHRAAGPIDVLYHARASVLPGVHISLLHRIVR